jgi:hypothetical protein
MLSTRFERRGNAEDLDLAIALETRKRKMLEYDF